MQSKFLCNLTIVAFLVLTFLSEIDACNRCGNNRCGCYSQKSEYQPLYSQQYLPLPPRPIPIPIPAPISIPVPAPVPVPVPVAVPEYKSFPIAEYKSFPIPEYKSFPIPEYNSEIISGNACDGCGGYYSGPVYLPRRYCGYCQKRKLLRLNENCY